MKYKPTPAIIIKSLRKERNISQEELAKVIGINRSKLSNIENNVSDPKVNEINLLCDYFNVSSDYLLGRVNNNVRNNIIDNIAYMFSLSSKSKTEIKKALPNHYYDFTELNKYIENGHLRRLLDLIDEFFYYDSIASASLKELQSEISNSDYETIVNIKKKIARSTKIADNYLDIIRYNLIFLVKAFPHDKKEFSIGKTYIDVLNDKQFADLITSIMEKKLPDY